MKRTMGVCGIRSQDVVISGAALCVADHALPGEV